MMSRLQPLAQRCILREACEKIKGCAAIYLTLTSSPKTMVLLRRGGVPPGESISTTP